MLSLVTGTIGFAAAAIIILLIRRDLLHVRFGLFWIAMAVAFVFLGVFPGVSDELARLLGVAYGPVLALTLALTVVLIKLLTMDLSRSKLETRIVRLVQRIAMLEAEIDRLKADQEQGPGKPRA